MNKNIQLDKQINHLEYIKHIQKIESNTEKTETQIFENSIKTTDLVLVAFMLIKKQELIKIPNIENCWSINKGPGTESLYKMYKEKTSMIEPKTFGKTLINLILKETKEYA
jgi:hypothetical protein